MIIDLIDEKSPHMGGVVMMSNNFSELNCSLAVSVICDSSGVQGPQALDKVGTCDYMTSLRGLAEIFWCMERKLYFCIEVI
ncbi:uncharacterized protein LOC114263090 isoform X5 [Camellia sinensis]|uniref:uncharacterized protein LOC114263090 isoform X5 n=1 Tax=Camellia sinensis TaxID=4442 RepID=UPI001036ADBF|nr:uncharacterized protein LOC114263090 isoform X5 [Camellia sinensis]